MEPMRLPDAGSPDVPSNEELAQRANQPRNAISGDEVGILDPVCKSDGFAGVQMFAEGCPDQSARTWDLLRTVLDEGFQSIDRRLRDGSK
jgi:hypothetical protein